MKKALSNLKYLLSDNKDDTNILKGLVAQYREVQIPLPLVFHSLVLRGLTKKESWAVLRRLQKSGYIHVSRNFITILKTEVEKNE
jgi:hypothetical protein